MTHKDSKSQSNEDFSHVNQDLSAIIGRNELSNIDEDEEPNVEPSVSSPSDQESLTDYY